MKPFSALPLAIYIAFLWISYSDTAREEDAFLHKCAIRVFYFRFCESGNSILLTT